MLTDSLLWIIFFFSHLTGEFLEDWLLVASGGGLMWIIYFLRKLFENTYRRWTLKRWKCYLHIVLESIRSRQCCFFKVTSCCCTWQSTLLPDILEISIMPLPRGGSHCEEPPNFLNSGTSCMNHVLYVCMHACMWVLFSRFLFTYPTSLPLVQDHGWMAPHADPLRFQPFASGVVSISFLSPWSATSLEHFCIT